MHYLSVFDLVVLLVTLVILLMTTMLVASAMVSVALSNSKNHLHADYNMSYLSVWLQLFKGQISILSCR